jgi:CRP-like cAMP-binding protein
MTDAKLKFVMSLPYMRFLSKTYVKKMIDNFVPLTCKRNQIIFKQGQMSDYFYVVNKGEF